MKKLNLLHLASTIASTFVSTSLLFAGIDINNRVKAIVVAGEPSDYIVNPGTGYDGVALLESFPSQNSIVSGGRACTGSLLPTGWHILTAAHCLTQTTEDVPLGGIPGKFDTSSTIVGFESPILSNQRFLGIRASEFYIHPDWNGEYLSGNDIAIIKLFQQAPPEIDRYDIYRGTDELNQVSTIVGYGVSGNGNTGATILAGVKRSGQNIYEFLLGQFADVTGVIISDAARNTVIGYDFDNGLVANDVFGYYGIPNTGLGLNEVTSFEGDSGGPVFINNLVVGITSFGGSLGLTPPEVDNERNGSFGEVSFDTRVSSYASYIDDVLAGKIQPTYKIPEPSTVLGSLLVLIALMINSNLRHTAKQKVIPISKKNATNG
ncbi:peptidase S1 and S6 chymotrypsin/Hap [Nostoc sp. NIES-4103]|nr:peptidase S1 and S6 chymotrypsin/Hap [Nostoc sp. NIES-4103]